MSSADDDFCYLTTTGRRTGRTHRIEIWFAIDGDRLYLLAGGRGSSDWVQNLAAEPAVAVELGGVTRRGSGRILDEQGDEATRARALVHAKYAPRSADDLIAWRDSAMPIAIDLEGPATG
jgi:deazaflavin-dependent oxidoreductase (nitroreductase family)